MSDMRGQLEWDKFFEVRVTFTSDWIVGTGAGRHRGVDRVAARDRDGFPYLPAKSFTGVLREQAQAAARALDGAAKGIWHDWLERIFGSEPSTMSPDEAKNAGPPVPAWLQTAPLRVAEPVRRWAGAAPTGGGPRRVDGFFTMRPGVKIDPRTGTAADDYYRTEERAIGGLTLTARWKVQAPGRSGPLPDEVIALLGAAASLVQGIGGKRRRGGGRASCTIPGMERETVRGILGDPENKGFTGPEALPSGSVPAHEAPEAQDLTGTAQKVSAFGKDLHHVADLLLHLDGPVLIDDSAAAVPGSVPGTMLLGHVAQVLEKQGIPVSELIRDQKLVVTDANPALLTGSEALRAVPWPAHWAADKDQGGKNLHVVDLTQAHRANPRFKPRRGRFVAASQDGTYSSLAVTRVPRAHAVLEDTTRRPTSEVGGLFVYTALEPGYTLISEVWLPQGMEIDVPRGTGSIRIGRSRKDDYGAASLSWRKPHETATNVHDSGNRFTVVCDSDILAYGATGRPEPSIMALLTALEEALESAGAGPVTLRQAEPKDDRKAGQKQVLAAIDTQQRTGWNVSWGLPRSPLPVIKAGSFLVVTTETPISGEALQRVVARGIGERRAEGFGRIRFHPAASVRSGFSVTESTESTESQVRPSAVTGVAQEAAELKPEHVNTVRAVLTAAWLKHLSGRAQDLAQDPEVREALALTGLSNAQIGARRRTAAVAAAHDKARKILTERVAELAGSSGEMFGLRDLRESDEVATTVHDRLNAIAPQLLITEAAKVAARANRLPEQAEQRATE